MENLRKFDLENDYLNEKDSLSYPNVSYTKDSEKVWIKKGLSKFYLNISYSEDETKKEVKEYYFEEGMTYADFVSSEYNDLFYVYYYASALGYDNDYATYEDGTQVNAINDIIENGINIYVTIIS